MGSDRTEQKLDVTLAFVFVGAVDSSSAGWSYHLPIFFF
jgi:hypothetical protein